MANQVSSTHQLDSLSSLPHDILLHIISYLDLQSISRLSRTCHSLSSFVLSDSIWRQISKNLVGPWIHRPQLQLTNYPQPLNLDPIPVDWTQDPNCFPLSHFIRSSSSQDKSQGNQGLINSWYQFATRFLIPHFHYLGWHTTWSEHTGREVILVTYDIVSGRLIAEEIKCQNPHKNPRFPGPGDHAPIEKPILPSSLSSMLALNLIRLKPNGYEYTISPEVASPLQGFDFVIFTPVFFSSPFFSISPFPPHYTLDSHSKLLNQRYPSEQLTLHKLSSDFYVWTENDLKTRIVLLHDEPKDSLVARRSTIVLRETLIEPTEDLVNIEGVGKKTLHCFKLIGTFSEESNVSSPVIQHPRIRYQRGPPPLRINVPDILLAGRTYHSTATGSLCPVVNSASFTPEYYPLNGPPSTYNQRQSTECWYDGLWVAYLESRELFAKIDLVGQLDTNTASSPVQVITLRQIPFILGSQMRRYVVKIPARLFRTCALTEALDSDTNVNRSDDAGWFKGVIRGTLPEEEQIIDLQDIEVQFIRTTTEPECLQSPGIDRRFDSIEQIRVKLIDDRLIFSFYKLTFQ